MTDLRPGDRVYIKLGQESPYYEAGASGVVLSIDDGGDCYIRFDCGDYEGAPKITEWYASPRRLALADDYPHADAQAEIDRLRALLIRARKFVEDDALMAGAITHHAPLPPEAQAIRDSTEYLSEILLREIDALLPNTADI